MVPPRGRVRGRFRVASVEDTPAGVRATIEAIVECDRIEERVPVGELLFLTVP